MRIDLWSVSVASNVNEVSRMISMVGSALQKSGPTPTQDRLMIHHLYRQHLSVLAMCGYPEHYAEVVSLLLLLSERGCLDPDLWLDMFNVFVEQDQDKLTAKSKIDDWTSRSLSIAASSQRITQLDDVSEKALGVIY